MALPDVAYPGLSLGPVSKFAAGPGTYVHGSNVCASVTGRVSARPRPDSKLQLVSVTFPDATSRGATVSRATSTGNTLPEVNSIVLARVTRLQARQATLAILVVDGAACADAFPGVVRKEDVRGWEVDKVVIGEAFRVGDVVRAVVVCDRWHSSAHTELTLARSRWATSHPTTSALPGMSLGFCLPRVKLATRCTRSAGRNSRTQRQAGKRPGRSPNLSRVTDGISQDTILGAIQVRSDIGPGQQTGSA